VEAKPESALQRHSLGFFSHLIGKEKASRNAARHSGSFHLGQSVPHQSASLVLFPFFLSFSLELLGNFI
jgi:hypothetical protein